MATAVGAAALDDAYIHIEVFDTDGGRTKYHKGGQAHSRAEPDLSADRFQDKIDVVPRADGTPRLQQKGPGLPRTIVVVFPNWPRPTPGAATGAVAGWQTKTRFEYEQEST